jgi:hypothetical protein
MSVCDKNRCQQKCKKTSIQTTYVSNIYVCDIVTTHPLTHAKDLGREQY